MRVGLTFNLKKDSGSSEDEPPSSLPDAQAEWDDQETISAVRDALAERQEVHLIEANPDAYDKLVSLRPDLVFNMAEGSRGVSREGQIPAILEFLGMRYTASDSLTLSLCLDKSRTKEVLHFYGIATPRFTVHPPSNGLRPRLKFPMVVKPLWEGSSKGVFNRSLVRTGEELQAAVDFVQRHYFQPALVEEYLDGREFTVAVLGNPPHERVLPLVEICFDSLPAGVNRIYSYEAKWVWDRAEHPLKIFQCPAEVDARLQREIEALCLKAYRVLRCRDWCRIDVRLDSAGAPHILELNPLPGILPRPEENSCFPLAARVAGMSYNQLINTVLDLACQRYGLTP